MLEFFMNQIASLKSVAYPQDGGGGEVIAPGTPTVGVPCCVQQDTRPEPYVPGQERQKRGSTSRVRVFFQPNDMASASAIIALKANDQIQVTNQSLFQATPQKLVLEGQAFDVSGRGVVWEVAAKEIR